MAVFKCKMCGGTIEVVEDAKICTCEYCGSEQTLPKLDSDRKANLYDRANHFRRNNEYDKAMGIYEQILNEDNTDAEAYWSLILCQYGIEYVEDPSSHKRVPTINRAQYTSIYADENYKSALQYADLTQKIIYEQEAKVIDDIQKGILAISEKEEPFDVFICYKETDESGRRTPDSVLANDLYHQLVQEGFKVFFARITLEDKLGQEYEPYIFAALNSAKVMVVLGTKPSYFSAVWVKNEWARYLGLIRAGQKKMLIPAYKDMDPYDLPDEFSHLQAQDMSKLGFMQDLIRGIKKIIGTEQKKTVVQEAVVQQPMNSNIAALLKRGYMALEDREWDKADGFFEEVLNQDAESAESYWGKYLAKTKTSNTEQLKKQLEDCYTEVECRDTLFACEKATDRIQKAVSEYKLAEYLNESDIREQYEYDLTFESNLAARKEQKNYYFRDIETDKNLTKARRYATGTIKEEIEGVIAYIEDVLNQKIAEAEASDRKEIAEINKSYQEFLEQADNKVQKLRQEADRKKQNYYQSLVNQKNKIKNLADQERARRRGETEKQFHEKKIILEYEKVKAKLAQLTGYKEAEQHAKECDDEIARIKSEQYKRKVAQERKTAKTVKKIAIVIAATLILIAITIGSVIFYTSVIVPNNINNNKYNEAVAMLENGQYQEAIEAFSDLGGFKDSKDKIVETKYASGIALMENGQYQEAIEAFSDLGGFKDSKDKIVEIKYASGIALMENGQYQEAIEAFSDLGGFKDSENKIVECGEKEKEAFREKYKHLSSASVGDIITFGNYKGNTEWRVLDKANGKLLLISRYALEERPYDTRWSEAWEYCSLRSWLNKKYLNAAFSNDDQALIATTVVCNPDYNKFGRDGGNDTSDKVFLLSIDEAYKYFTSSDDRKTTLPDGTSAWWWLRSPGSGSVGVANVNSVGSVNARGNDINDEDVAVRPALWIDISNL